MSMESTGAPVRTVFSVRADLMQRHWSTITFTNLLVTIATGYMLWGHFDHQAVLVWCGLSGILIAVRLSFKWLLEQQRIHPDPRQRLAFYTSTAVFAGLIWVYAILLFLDPVNIDVFVFLLVVILGLCAGSLPIYAVHMPAHYGFSGVVLTVITAQLFMIDQDELQWLSVLSVIFLVTNVVFAHNLNRIINNAITLDLKNSELLSQVTEAKELAENANRSKSRFLAAASHDLRQPLYAMGLFIEALRRRVTDPDKRQIIGYLGSSQKSLETLFNALLEVSKLDAGVVEIRRENFDIGAMVSELGREITPEAEAKGLRMVIEDCRALVYSDRILVERILRNLLSNAVRYTEHGQVRLSCCNHDGSQVEVVVADTGVGIPADEHTRVFDEFHQAGSVKRNGSGMGLGLAIVKRMADLLGHEVSLKSELEQGSVFSLVLPAGRTEARAAAVIRAGEDRLAGTRVLLLDDEEDVLIALTLVLEDWGCEVMSARDSTSALAQADSTPPDVLLVDFQLAPQDGASGLDVVRAIRKRTAQQIPAVVISGLTDPQLLREVRGEGLQLLYKPVDIETLHATLVALVGAARRLNA